MRKNKINYPGEQQKQKHHIMSCGRECHKKSHKGFTNDDVELGPFISEYKQRMKELIDGEENQYYKIYYRQYDCSDWDGSIFQTEKYHSHALLYHEDEGSG